MTDPTPHHPASPHLDLLDRSGASLVEACHATASRDRYLKAHLAALRAAAAYLAAGSGDATADGSHDAIAAGAGRPGRGLWEALATSDPELREWAVYFATTGSRARRILRGAAPGTVWVSSRDADDLVRSAETFVDAVAVLLGAPRAAAPARLTPLTR